MLRERAQPRPFPRTQARALTSAAALTPLLPGLLRRIGVRRAVFGLSVLLSGVLTLAAVLALTALSLGTALVGLIVIFPLLGHATWHAYAAVRG